MYYRVVKVNENTVVLENITEGKEETLDFAELNKVAENNIVIGYNKLTGELKVSTKEDYAKYRLSKIKLLKSNGSIEYNETSDTYTTNAVFQIDDDTVYVTVANEDDIKTEGRVFVPWDDLAMSIMSEDISIKHIVYDIPTDNYTEVSESTSAFCVCTSIKHMTVDDITFTDRCTFKGITQLQDMFSAILPTKTPLDLSKLDFSSVNAVWGFMRNADTINNKVIFPEEINTVSNLSGEEIFMSMASVNCLRGEEIFDNTDIDYEGTKFLANFDSLGRVSLSHLVIDAKRTREHLEILKDILESIEDGFEVEALTLPMNDEVITELYPTLYDINVSVGDSDSDYPVQFDFRGQYDNLPDKLENESISLGYKIEGNTIIPVSGIIPPHAKYYFNFVDTLVDNVDVFQLDEDVTAEILCDELTFKHAIVFLESLAHANLKLIVDSDNIDLKSKIMEYGGTVVE